MSDASLYQPLTGAQIAARLAANGFTVADNKLIVTGSSDSTKHLVFECDALTASKTLTLGTGAQTVDRTLTAPVLTGNRVLAVIDQAQTFTATQTFGGIDATSIGATTRGTGLFTTLGANGVTSITNATAATSAGTGALVVSGGLGLAGNLISALGLGHGVTSTATAAGTTVLASTSTAVQVFTGTTTQTVTLPAANLFGAGVAVVFIIKNRSTGSVTVNRAGSDTIDGATSIVIAGGASETLASDGVSDWVRI